MVRGRLITCLWSSLSYKRDWRLITIDYWTPSDGWLVEVTKPVTYLYPMLSGKWERLPCEMASPGGLVLPCSPNWSPHAAILGICARSPQVTQQPPPVSPFLPSAFLNTMAQQDQKSRGCKVILWLFLLFCYFLGGSRLKMFCFFHFHEYFFGSYLSNSFWETLLRSDLVIKGIEKFET